MSLRKSALSGMFWTFVQQMSTQGITFVVSIILARLLLPEEFGLIALLSVFIALGNVIINSGLSQSLIRTENIEESDYSAVFYFNLLLSIIMYLIMYSIAPLVANFYNQELLTILLRVYCLVFIINSLSIIQFTRLTKELNFKRQMIISIPSLIISSIVGIVMALNGYGVWSLVWSAIIKGVALTIQCWIYMPWLPNFKFDLEKIKYHLSFGYKLTLSGIINTLFQEIYTILIGKYFDPIQVGFYNRANTLRQLPVKNLAAVLSKVTYPLFSKIKDDDIKLKNAYKKIMQMSVFIMAPVLLLMSALAEPLFRFLLTEKWLPAVPYFQILCFNGILYPVNSFNLNMLNVKGRSDLYLKLEILKKILATVIITISFQWGIYGLLYGYLFLSIVGLLFNAHYSGKFINYSTWEQLKDIFPTIFIAFFSALIVWYIDSYLESFRVRDILRLLISSLLGVFIYLSIAFLFKLNSLKESRLILFSKYNV